MSHFNVIFHMQVSAFSLNFNLKLESPSGLFPICTTNIVT